MHTQNPASTMSEAGSGITMSEAGSGIQDAMRDPRGAADHIARQAGESLPEPARGNAMDGTTR